MVKEDSSLNPNDPNLNEELQSTLLTMVGKDERIVVDDQSNASGYVDKTLNQGLPLFASTIKKVSSVISRISQDSSTAASKMKSNSSIQQPMVTMDLRQNDRGVSNEDDQVIETSDSSSTGEEQEQEQAEGETILTLKTEDEIQQVVDFVVDHVVSCLGLSNDFKSTTWNACHACVPEAEDREPVASVPLARKRKDRQILSKSRAHTIEQSSRQNPEEPLTEDTPPEVGDLMSASGHESELETFSRHSLMGDKSSKSKEPEKIKINQRGKEMIIDRRTFEAIMDFLAYPEKYLHLNPPKTDTRKLIASLKRRREHATNKATPDEVVVEATTDAKYATVADSHTNSNERVISESDRGNFEDFMDFIAFPEKHCIPKLKASLPWEYMEHITSRTGIDQAAPSGFPCPSSAKINEKVLTDFLDQQGNLCKNSPQNTLNTGPTQQEKISCGEENEGSRSLNELRRDRSLISQCSTTTDDSSHSSSRSSRMGRFFGSDRATNMDRGSSKSQRNKNAVQRYLSVASKH